MRRGIVRIVRGASLALALLTAAPALGQELPEEVTDACVRAAVKIIMLSDSERGGGSTGSGSMIDPRGYVLTNFHVVGHMRPETGRPGTLYNRQNRVHLATVESARQSARPRWHGVVVRGDVRLDLALVRIISDTDGNQVGDHRFPTVQIAPTERLRPGSRVWAFGFPLGVRTINVTEGAIAGFQMNANDEVAWLRSDAEFNPGNSGGMLVDQRGRLIGVPTRVYHGTQTGRALEPVELARPAERVPAEWLQALRRGHITDVRLTGVGDLNEGRPMTTTANGDHGSVGAPDQHFFNVPAQPRPARVTTRQPLPIALMHREGVIREGRGSVEVQPGDPPDPVISILVPGAGERAVTYSIGLERIGEAGEAQAAATETPPVAAATETPPTLPTTPTPPATNPPPSNQATVAFQGTVIDPASGQPVDAALVFVFKPASAGGPARPEEAISQALSGRISQRAFEAMLAAATRTDVHGVYRFRSFPPGQSFAGGVLRSGYRPASVQFNLSERPQQTVGAIRLTRER